MTGSKAGLLALLEVRDVRKSERCSELSIKKEGTFLQHREHPYRMQVNDDVRYGRVYVLEYSFRLDCGLATVNTRLRMSFFSTCIYDGPCSRFCFCKGAGLEIIRQYLFLGILYWFRQGKIPSLSQKTRIDSALWIVADIRIFEICLKSLNG